MTGLPTLYGSAPALPAKVSRQLSRDLALIDARAELARQHDRARINRVTEVAQRGQMAVAQLSAMEVVHAQAVPHAAGRIKQITDVATIGIAQIVMEAGMS